MGEFFNVMHDSGLMRVGEWVNSLPKPLLESGIYPLRKKKCTPEEQHSFAQNPGKLIFIFIYIYIYIYIRT